MCVNNRRIYKCIFGSSVFILVLRCFCFYFSFDTVPNFAELHAQCVHKPDVDVGLTKPNTFSTFWYTIILLVAVSYGSFSTSYTKRLMCCVTQTNKLFIHSQSQPQPQPQSQQYDTIWLACYSDSRISTLTCFRWIRAILSKR